MARAYSAGMPARSCAHTFKRSVSCGLHSPHQRAGAGVFEVSIRQERVRSIAAQPAISVFGTPNRRRHTLTQPTDPSS